MNRRKFLAAAFAALVGAQAGSRVLRAENDAPPIVGDTWRRFEITTRVELPGVLGPAQLWLPLAQTAADYQTAFALHWYGTGHTERVHDAHYGAPILWTSWDEKDHAPRRLDVVQTVATRDRTATPFLPLTEAERQFWTSPNASVPVDGIVKETASRITAGKTAPRDRLRAIYDWVVDNTYRNPATFGCGRGNIAAMLKLGQLGGKCADINGLLVGLSRASGFPARDVYGIRVAESYLYPSLGRCGNLSKAQHCRAEVFLDDEGWFPLDAADVGKVVLEQKLALESPEVIALREHLFGAWEMNWVGYNSGTDIQLPGVDSGRTDFPFFMYPRAVSAEMPLPSLDPDRFQYEIVAREINA